MSKAAQNKLAILLRSLHKPGDPVIMANVWDAVTAEALTKVPGVKAVATASYAIAAARGVADNDMTFEQNLDGIRSIAPKVAAANLPLSVDLQDGYEDVAASIKAIIELGVVGCNLEDFNDRTNSLRPKEEAVERLKIAMKAAKEAGVPDFCINARTDVVVHGGSIDDAIDRAHAYLDAGAHNSFVWGGGARGLRTEEVARLAEALDGRLNVIRRLTPEGLTLGELKEIGVARISVGPTLQFKALEAFKKAAQDMLEK
ncbi:carboxyphosphonoenolpyruvate phosphonomutase-like protein [Microthyrium microscopicum]|uniref:Carboxyphosphonoenolpyruvate phosphonomutase-like protein n=1 Tax=Microthyrium microscopicum TaxID=703497 RepID=A0A6A6UFL7_9PEZI|nr:carboxyphosphonoenolpyruvate phosphonomutase-like protein [Microthyrium microscopicum]